MSEGRQQIAGSQDVPLQQGAAPNYALLVNVAPGVALLVDVQDRAGRLLGIVYGENAQLQQLTPADALAPNESLEVTGFNMVYDPVAGDWNRLREGAAIGQALTDPADRATRLVGVIYGSQAAQIQQVAGTFELITQDTGLNTNPRRYEKDNGFYSAVTARAGGVATAMWTIATTPDRTAGQETTIYHFHIENSTGAAATAWLEVGGVPVTPHYHVSDNDSVTIDWLAGLDTGNQDINLNASVNDVVGQVSGTEV